MTTVSRGEVLAVQYYVSRAVPIIAALVPDDGTPPVVWVDAAPSPGLRDVLRVVRDEGNLCCRALWRFVSIDQRSPDVQVWALLRVVVTRPVRLIFRLAFDLRRTVDQAVVEAISNRGALAIVPDEPRDIGAADRQQAMVWSVWSPSLSTALQLACVALRSREVSDGE